MSKKKSVEANERRHENEKRIRCNENLKHEGIIGIARRKLTDKINAVFAIESVG